MREEKLLLAGSTAGKGEVVPALLLKPFEEGYGLKREGTVDQLRYFVGSQWSLSILPTMLALVRGDTLERERRQN